MGTPRILVENFFNTHQFPDHTVDAEEEPTGTEAWRAGTGRRDTALNLWTSSTANSDTYLDATCDRTRLADMLVLDGHNLAGYPVELRASQDDFTTYSSPFDMTVPAVTSPGSVTDGVLTEENAFVIKFDPTAATYWRIFIDAMGAGLKPQITGAYLGLSYAPAYSDYPLARDNTRAFAVEITSEKGHLGRGPTMLRPEGSFSWHVTDWVERDQVRYHIEHLFAEGYPAWWMVDDDQADQCIPIVRAPNSQVGFVEDRQNPFGRVQLPYVEHERPVSP